MQNIPVEDFADGYTRAQVATIGRPQVAKTANYTINALEAGTLFTNRGAAGAVQFTLPPPKDNMAFYWAKAVPGQNIAVVTDTGATKINHLTQGTTLTESTNERGFLALVAEGGEWHVASLRGTWAIS